MSDKSQARAVQKASGARYMGALTEVRKRRARITDLKRARPEMSLSDCAVAVCFEDLADLQSRWGDIFHPNEAKP